MTEFTVTVTWTYRVSDEELEKFYFTDDPEEAGRADEKNYYDYPDLLAEELSGTRPDGYRVTVRPRKTED